MIENHFNDNQKDFVMEIQNISILLLLLIDNIQRLLFYYVLIILFFMHIVKNQYENQLDNTTFCPLSDTIHVIHYCICL